MSNVKFVESHIKFETVIQPLVPYLESGLCTKSIHYKISECKYSILENITNFIFNQKSLPICSEHYVSQYAINTDVSNITNITNTKAEFRTCFEEKFDPDDWPISLMKVDKNILLNIISPNVMYEHITLNNTNDYFIIPVSFDKSYKDDKKKSGHCACLIFDNIHSEAYFFDPNGWTNYFNELSYDNIKYTILIEKLFDKYLEDLKDFTGIKYILVPTFHYNPLNLYLNKSYSGSQVDYGGNCVAFTILFAHYVILTSKTNKTIKSCLKDLANLNNNQLIQLINDYSIGLYRFIEPLLNEYKKQLSNTLIEKYKKNPELITEMYEGNLTQYVKEKVNKMFDYNELDELDELDELNEFNELNEFEELNKYDKPNNFNEKIIKPNVFDEFNDLEKEYLKFFIN